MQQYAADAVHRAVHADPAVRSQLLRPAANCTSARSFYAQLNSAVAARAEVAFRDWTERTDYAALPGSKVTRHSATWQPATDNSAAVYSGAVSSAVSSVWLLGDAVATVKGVLQDVGLYSNTAVVGPPQEVSSHALTATIKLENYTVLVYFVAYCTRLSHAEMQ
jgi:hypothetical protein